MKSVDDFLAAYPAKEEEARPDSVESFLKRYPSKEAKPPADLKEWTAKYPVLESIGKGVQSAIDFAEKPFGYDNPPVSKILDFSGARSIPKTLDALAYGDRLTKGKGETLQLKDETLDTALLAAPALGKLAKATKGLPVGMGITDVSAAPRALNEVLAAEPYTLKSIEGLATRSGNKGIISTQALKDELNRPGISKFEKEILTPFTLQDGGVRAEDLIKGVRDSTKDFRLTPHTHDQWADYGLDNIGRGGGWSPTQENTRASGAPARTTTWQVPEGVSGSTANHFQDPNYFGHTRAFEEDGIPHVVEVQSDLMQNKKLVGPKRDEVEAEFREVEKEIERVISRHNELKDNVAKARAAGMTPVWPGNLKDDLNPLYLKRDELLAKITVGNTEKDIEPMRKTHVERLVKEELSMADQNGQGVVRFAAPDTVAKVEGWPDATRDAIERIADAEAKLPKAGPESARFLNSIIDNDKDILKNVRKHRLEMAEQQVAYQEADLMSIADGRSRRTKTDTEEELRKAKSVVEFYKKHLNDPVDAPLFNPEHHGIYANYKDMEKYLKSIGGTDYVDKYGHRWIEVPVKGAKSPVKSGRVPMFSITGAPLATGVGAGYNANQQESSK